PTGAAQAWRGDPDAVAKRTLKSGEKLDGEGGYTVYGKLVPAARSRAEGALPIGLAHGVELRREVPAGAIVRESDVILDESALAVRVRRQMVGAFAPASHGAGAAA
ncbi:MAG: SAF domain-containing protein, partial [Geminicoccaceae bacterium]